MNPSNPYANIHDLQNPAFNPLNTAQSSVNQALSAPKNDLNMVANYLSTLFPKVQQAVSGINSSQLPSEVVKALIPRLSQFNKDYGKYTANEKSKLSKGQTFQNPIPANIQSAQMAAPLAGDLAPMALAGAGGVSALGGGLGGAFRGMTTPDASLQQRLGQGALQGGTGALIGLLLQGIHNMISPTPAEPGTDANPIKMDITPQTSADFSQGMGKNLNGGSLPDVLTRPNITSNTPPIVDAQAQMAENIARNSPENAQLQKIIAEDPELQQMFSQEPDYSKLPGTVQNYANSNIPTSIGKTLSAVWDHNILPNAQGGWGAGNNLGVGITRPDLAQKLMPFLSKDYMDAWGPTITSLLEQAAKRVTTL